ncbi:MAG: septum formation initiator family protein [Spirochaetales bacterium]|nr:septum formation initiator family protein [Spirochaetales bacterium]
MKFYHILIILYLGIILGSLLVLFFGDDGYLTFMLYKEHRDILCRNIEDLKKKNMQLVQKIKLLRSNPEVIRILARKLGYYGSDENIIFLNEDVTPGKLYEIGTIIKEIRGRPERNLLLKIIGFSASVFLGILFILLKQRKNHDHQL